MFYADKQADSLSACLFQISAVKNHTVYETDSVNRFQEFKDICRLRGAGYCLWI